MERDALTTNPGGASCLTFHPMKPTMPRRRWLAPEEAAEKPRPARAKKEESERSSLLGALSAGLDEIVPGLEILDRELALEGARADLAAIDPAGRIHLVLLAAEADKDALDVLDTLSFLRSHTDLLVRHLADRRVDPERSPRIFVISPSSDVRLVERLAPLQDAGVHVLGLSAVKSAAGERSYLVRLDRPRQLSVLSVAALGVNVALNLILIPRWGPVGCALATSAGYVTLATAQVAWFIRSSGVRPAALVPGPADLALIVGAARERFAPGRPGPRSRM